MLSEKNVDESDMYAPILVTTLHAVKNIIINKHKQNEQAKFQKSHECFMNSCLNIFSASSLFEVNIFLFGDLLSFSFLAGESCSSLW